MKITNVKQTCVACPSQWEALTPDGYGVYVRYRWGFLSVRVLDVLGQSGVKGKEVYSMQLGKALDGNISRNRVALIIDKLSYENFADGEK